MHTRLLAAYTKSEEQDSQKPFFPKVKIEEGDIPESLLKDLPQEYLAKIT